MEWGIGRQDSPDEQVLVSPISTVCYLTYVLLLRWGTIPVRSVSVKAAIWLRAARAREWTTSVATRVGTCGPSTRTSARPHRKTSR